MAIIKCNECGNSVSTEASSCPHCGAPQQMPVDAPPTMRQKPNTQEEIIHSDSDVSVTTTRVIIRGTTYALRNITSVRMAFTPPRTGCAIILLIAGIIYMLTALPEVFQGRAGATVFVFAGLVTAVAVLWLRSLKKDYHVAISSSSGEANALTSKDKGYIEGVVNSINEAIVKYQ